MKKIATTIQFTQSGYNKLEELSKELDKNKAETVGLGIAILNRTLEGKKDGKRLMLIDNKDVNNLKLPAIELIT